MTFRVFLLFSAGAGRSVCSVSVVLSRYYLVQIYILIKSRY